MLGLKTADTTGKNLVKFDFSIANDGLTCEATVSGKRIWTSGETETWWMGPTSNWKKLANHLGLVHTPLSDMAGYLFSLTQSEFVDTTWMDDWDVEL